MEDRRSLGRGPRSLEINPVALEGLCIAERAAVNFCGFSLRNCFV